ncbi:MAG: hypothetical protein CMF56_03750 [Leifsonia sp.]|nr:hypothetical protein [Leifsonia sp.]|tara:strand:+ start:51954 stop:52523 length:570 start_codon:yes stop_codon:yes gene_type:complete
MARFPQDEFDSIPSDLERVGAHRAPRGKGRAWINVGLGILAAAVLVVAGLYGLSRLDPSFTIDLPDFSEDATVEVTASPLPVAEPVTDPSTVDTDPELSLSVLNGTETTGQQDVAADQLVASGWPDAVRARAAASDIETTTIYYWNADFEGLARGVAEALGVGTVVLSDAYQGAPITVLLGSDYDPSAG